MIKNDKNVVIEIRRITFTTEYAEECGLIDEKHTFAFFDPAIYPDIIDFYAAAAGVKKEDYTQNYTIDEKNAYASYDPDHTYEAQWLRFDGEFWTSREHESRPNGLSEAYEKYWPIDQNAKGV